MIVRQVSLQVPVERQGEFVTFFKEEYRVAMSRQKGFVAARLLRSTDSTEELQMTLEFESEEHATRWRASPDHVRLSPRLKGYSPSLTVRVLTPLA